MGSCPYTSHQDRWELPTEGILVGSCRDGCGRTFFVCPNCQETNRPLARYCRQCSQPISFEETETRQPASAPLREDRSVSYKLSDQGVTEVQALATHKGFLIVVGGQSVLLYDLHKIHEPLSRFIPPDNRPVRGVTTKSSADQELLLVTTSRSIYALNLLTLEVDPMPIYEAPSGRYIALPVISCAGQLFVLELSEEGKPSHLARLPGGDILSFAGVPHSLVRLSEEQFLFCAENRIFLYSEDKVVEQHVSDRLEESAAAYSQSLETVYLVGESGLWRLSVSNGQLNLASLPTSRLGAPRLVASDESLIVAHSQGLLVLDPFGSVRWNSLDHFIRAESDGFSPQIAERYLLFSALGSAGGSVLRIHTLGNMMDFKVKDYEHRFLCPPILTLGRVLSVTGGAGDVLLGSAT